MSNIEEYKGKKNTKANEKASAIKKIGFNYSLLFMPAFFIYLEIIFLSLQDETIRFVSLPGLVLAIFEGLVIDIILVIFLKHWKIIIYIVTVICIVVYILESYLNKIFSTYVTFTAIHDMTDNVVNNYHNEIIYLIFKNSYIIVLYIVPIIALLFLSNKMNFKIEKIKGYILAIPVTLAILYLVIIFTCYSDSVIEHTFNSTAHKYGLGNAMMFNIISPKYTLNNAADNTNNANVEMDNEEYNVLALEYDDVTKDNIYSGTILKLNNFVENSTPSKKNEYTGLFKDKNLIMICAESFYGGAVNEQLTPALYRLMNNGFKFNDFYNALYSVSTSAGEYTYNLGMIPTYGVESMYHISNKNNYFTMANQLKRRGYKTSCFHNGSFDFYNRHITHESLGYDYYMAFGNGLEKRANNRSDFELFDKTIDLYMNEKKFMAYYMTYDGHLPYNTWDGYFTKFYEKVDTLYGTKIEYERRNYFAKLASFDEAIGNLISKLEKEGKLSDVVICITADHYPYGLGFADNDSIDNLYGYEVKVNDLENRDKNKMILWCEDMEKRSFTLDKDIDTPTCVIDILPTLSNLFSLPFDSRLMPGRDVFSDKEALVVWDDYSFKTENFFFNHEDEVIRANENYVVSDEELQKYRDIVRDMVMLSKDVINADYFNYLFKNHNITIEDEDDANVNIEDNFKNGTVTYANVVDMILKFPSIKTMMSICRNGKNSGFETVKFGRYEQDNVIENGPEDIEWLIVDKTDRSVMLWSKYILDASTYCANDQLFGWDTSNVKLFLNEVFYKVAFNDNEKQIIFEYNGDKVLVMPYEFLNSYFEIDNNKIEDVVLATSATKYAKAKGLYVRKSYDKKFSGNSAYWLKDSLSQSIYNASVVEYNGYVSLNGVSKVMDNQGIRPMIWIYW